MAKTKEIYRRNGKRRRSFKIPTPFIYALLITVAFYFFIHSPVFNIKHINVTGNNMLATEKILSLSQVNIGQNIMKIEKEEIIKMIAVHPFVKEVQIKRHLPYTLEIQVLERQPVGLLVSQDGFIQVSDEGYFLALVHDIGDYALPVISGLNLEELPGPGQIIKNSGLNMALNIIKESPQSLLENIVEINIENEKYILAYTIDGIEIRLGSLDDISNKLIYLNDIIEEFNKKGIDKNKIEYLDLRFSGPPIIKEK